MIRFASAIRSRFSLLTNRRFPVSDRLRSLAMRRQASGDFLIRRRLRCDDEGRRYFDIAGDRFYFELDGSVKHDEKRVAGCVMVLGEAYIDAPTVYWRHVRANPGDTVLDLGANVGTASLRFGRDVGPDGRVFAFEPGCPDVLQRNLDANGLTNVEVVPEAVADQVGEAEFATTDAGIDSRLDAQGKGGRRRVVPVTTLDAFVARRGLDRLDYIKMDIEGAERFALLGAAETIKRFRPKWSISSYHQDGFAFSGEPQHPKLVKLLTETYGYTIREVGRGHIYAW